jgi:hypothetical protein
MPIRERKNDDDGADCKLKLFAFHVFTLQDLGDIITSIYLGCVAVVDASADYTHKNMKRYPMFDPPEYVNWTLDESIFDEYERTIQRDRQRSQIISQLNESQLLGIYSGMLRFRLHDIALRRWFGREFSPRRGSEQVRKP